MVWVTKKVEKPRAKLNIENLFAKLCLKEIKLFIAYYVNSLAWLNPFNSIEN